MKKPEETENHFVSAHNTGTHTEVRPPSRARTRSILTKQLIEPKNLFKRRHFLISSDPPLFVQRMTHDETEKLQLSLQVEGVLRGLCAKNSLDGVGRYDGWLVIKRFVCGPGHRPQS